MRKEKWIQGMPCFFCNVDSDELRLMVIATIGGMILFSVLTAIGLYLRGSFKDPEKLNDYPLKCEEEL